MEINKEVTLIKLIADRASRMYTTYQINIRPEIIERELKYVHFELHGLCLEDLLHAGIDDFTRDIIGIHDHLDILNGNFKDGFIPRFSQ